MGNETRMSSKKNKYEKLIDNLVNDFWFSNRQKLEHEEGDITQEFVNRNMMNTTTRVSALIELNKKHLKQLVEDVFERLMKGFLRTSPEKTKYYILKVLEAEYEKLNNKIPRWLHESGQLRELNRFQDSVNSYMTKVKEGVENRCFLWEEQRRQRKKWWQEYPLFIAIFAVCISIYSAFLSREEFIAAHRPYIYATSRKSENGTMDLNTVLLSCFNAPAKITNRELFYVAFKESENGREDHEIKFDKKFSNEIVLYPTDTTKSQITMVGYDFKKEILEKDPEVKLKRKIKIDYKELSSGRTYYFEGNWDYNRQYNVWEDGNMLGN